jgi:hypothetical protein
MNADVIEGWVFCALLLVAGTIAAVLASVMVP